MKVHGVEQRIWPQSKVDRLGLAGVRMEQLLVCTLQEVSDGLLGNSILEVHVNAIKGELLSHVVACLLKGIVMRFPIVAVVVKNFHSMFSRVLLNGKLGGKCFRQQIVKLKVDKAETAVVVNKDGGVLVALLDKFAFQLRVETHFSQRHLVDGDTLSTFGCDEHFVISLDFLALCQGSLVIAPKRQPMHLGSKTLASFFGLSPLRASCLSLGKLRWPRR